MTELKTVEDVREWAVKKESRFKSDMGSATATVGARLDAKIDLLHSLLSMLPKQIKPCRICGGAPEITVATSKGGRGSAFWDHTCKGFSSESEWLKSKSECITNWNKHFGVEES